MVVRIDDIRKKEDKPRFVSRKQRLQLRHEFESIASPSIAKRVKIDNGSDVTDFQLIIGQEETNPRLPGSPEPENQTAVEPPVAERLAEYPIWRLEKETQAKQDAEQRSKATGQVGSNSVRHKKWNEKSRSEMTERDWRIMRRDLQIVCASLPNLEPLLTWLELPDTMMAQKLANGLYKHPSPIQRATVPLALDGKDVIGIAQTGSGKTLSFTVPLLLSRRDKSLVLAPTRELALQTSSVITEFAHIYGINVVLLVGGRDFGQQSEELEAATNTSSALIVVATPGRLLDFTEQKLLSLCDCSFLVLDEADRMIDLGFEEQIAKIMSLLPKIHQTLMYTATWPRQIQDLAAKFTRHDSTHKVEIGSTRRSTSVKQSAEILDSQSHKLARLKDLIQKTRPPVIAFVAKKAECDEIAPRLPSAMPLHGSMTQEKRESTINALRNGSIKCIIATDVASRGLDIPDVSLVVNYDMPSDIDTYIHRIGRTGRAGRQGQSVSLCLPSDSGLFKDLRRVFRESGSSIPSFLL